MSIEAMKQMANYIDALGGDSKKYRQAIAEAEKQEPVVHQDWCASLTRLLLSMPPQPAPCDCQPIKRKAEKQERYFCERCGKRLSGGIHTCTPPVEACG